ncbi:Ff.00g040380.m01.CDS01 [Fusarium sp. VM40]|nr:Ff.00g040380.m01.CDS01 [Fusarium sp. VM40]
MSSWLCPRYFLYLSHLVKNTNLINSSASPAEKGKDKVKFSKNNAAAIIKANLRLLPDSERSQVLSALNIQIPKFKAVERSQQAAQQVQKLDAIQFLPQRRGQAHHQPHQPRCEQGRQASQPLAARGELRSAAMSYPQGLPTKTMATKAYDDMKTRFGETPVKRPKNSNLFTGGRFLPEMRRAHSPGQEMDAPVFAEDFISRYEDTRWISAVAAPSNAGVNQRNQVTKHLHIARQILATLNAKLTDEVMEIIINAFPANAEKHHVKLMSPL